MKINEMVLKEMFIKPPIKEQHRFVFLVDDEYLEDQILLADYISLGIGNDKQKRIFLQIAEDCQFTYMKDRYFAPCSKFGLVGEVSKELEDMGFTVLWNAWKMFYNKKDCFRINTLELKRALEEYVRNVSQISLDKNESVEAKGLDMLSLNDIEEKMVDWLVLDYIPKGQITILAGDGGSGKTLVWCEIAASISNGDECFLTKSMTPNVFFKDTPQKVMFFSAEDSIEAVIKPRLRRSGANLENILSIDIADDRFGEIRFDSPFLEKLIDRYRPALVVYDPIQAFIPSNIKMSERNAMRNCLRSLVGYGEKYGCTSIIVVHTNKQTGLWGRKRIADSADIWDIARSVLIVGETREKNIKYLSHEKSNYGVTSKTALFSVNAGKVKFRGYSDKKDKDFVMEGNSALRYYAPQREEAKAFILDFLRDGEKKVSEVNSVAKAAGHSESAIKRAKTELLREKRICIYSVGNGRGDGKKVFYMNLCSIDK